MNKLNFLRFALVNNGEYSQTLNTSLSKYVRLSLYNNGNTSMTAFDISKYIQTNFELEFTEKEILECITHTKNIFIKTVSTKKSHIGSKSVKSKVVEYSLNVKTYDKIQAVESSAPYESIIQLFLETHTINSHNVEQIKELIFNFFYNIFDTNKDTILSLLKPTKSNRINPVCLSHLKEIDKKVLNDFLNWDNDKKNKLIFSIITDCIDYCMLSVKKDSNSIRNLFHGKKFYLDTCVIFRMIGLNNEERKYVIDSFINKALKNGIKIYYTNFTLLEIRETIHYKVQAISKSLNGRRMVDIKYYDALSSSYQDIDFMRAYYNWSKTAGKRYNKFSEFEKYLLSTINDILSKFTKDPEMIYKGRNKSFDSLFDDLKEYKRSKKGYIYDKSIETDINNFLHVYEMRKRSKGTTFIDTHEYFITTDANLCDWSADKYPSTLPLVVLPSVWHSLLLRFAGRANKNKDYKAFALFLNIRYSIADDENDERKKAILSIVQDLDEPTTLKNLVLENITQHFSDKYESIANPKQIVNTAISDTLQQIVDDKTQESEALVKQSIYLEEAEGKVYRRITFVENVSNISNWILIGAIIIILFALVTLVLINGFSYLPTLFMRIVQGGSIEQWISIIMIITSLVKLLVSLLKKQINKVDITKRVENQLTRDNKKREKTIELKKKQSLKEE